MTDQHVKRNEVEKEKQRKRKKKNRKKKARNMERVLESGARGGKQKCNLLLTSGD
jgi:hypothetical protein